MITITFFKCLVMTVIVALGVSLRPQCQFDVFNTSDFTKLLAMSAGDVLPNNPKVIWSKLIHLPARSPPYATFAVSELKDVRINLMSGAVFNSAGCISKHFMQTPELHNRLRFLPGISPGPSKAYRYDDYRIEARDVIYFGGSLHSKDWQHAVIDFLPMFNFALPFIVSKKNVTIIAGKYARFFESLFPFNLARYLPKDYKYRTHHQYPIAPCFFVKNLLYVDILQRDQSYTQSKAYERILPFLFDKVDLSVAARKSWIAAVMTQAGNKPSSTTMSPATPNGHEPHIANISQAVVNAMQQQCVVLYLDRSQLVSDAQYIKSTGKIVGRNVVNQDKLLQTIKKSLKPHCQFIVWTCKNWEIDRNVFQNATVVLGPHGGHFVNMIFSPPGTHIIEFGRSYTLRQLRNFTGSTGNRNARWVFAGMSSALGHYHWFIEDTVAVQDYVKKNIKPLWTDDDIHVNSKQVIDTLREIGVAK